MRFTDTIIAQCHLRLVTVRVAVPVTDRQAAATKAVFLSD